MLLLKDFLDSALLGDLSTERDINKEITFLLEEEIIDFDTNMRLP